MSKRPYTHQYNNNNNDNNNSWLCARLYIKCISYIILFNPHKNIISSLHCTGLSAPECKLHEGSRGLGQSCLFPCPSIQQSAWHTGGAQYLLPGGGKRESTHVGDTVPVLHWGNWGPGLRELATWHQAWERSSGTGSQVSGLSLLWGGERHSYPPRGAGPGPVTRCAKACDREEARWIWDNVVTTWRRLEREVERGVCVCVCVCVLSWQ